MEEGEEKEEGEEEGEAKEEEERKRNLKRKRRGKIAEIEVFPHNCKMTLDLLRILKRLRILQIRHSFLKFKLFYLRFVPKDVLNTNYSLPLKKTI